MADLDLTNFQGFLDYEGLDYFKEKNDILTDEKIAVETERATNAENTLSNNLNSHTSNKSNPHGVTKSQVGLGNVDNTSDVDKPISTATQTALNAKAPLASPTFTGTPKAPTATAGTNTTQIATTAFVQSAVTTAKNDLLNGAGTAYDTLKELGDLIDDNADAIDALETIATSKANVTDLTNHTGNTTVHITSTERTNWNDANSKKHTHSNKTILDNTTASYTTAEQTKLSGVATGAEVNQNAFSNVVVGSTTIAADAKQDTLTLVAGTNVTLTPDATNDKITIAATDTKYTHPSYTAKSSGLYKVTVDSTGHVSATTAVAKADITALGIPAQDTTYTHPTYTARTGVPTANQTPAFGGTFSVNQITSDGTGHVTAATSRTITIPSTLSNGTGTAGLIKTTSTVTSNSGYTACPVINGVPYYKGTAYTHPTSGVTAGTYRSVTVDANGHVTAGSNPTTTVAQGGTGLTTLTAGYLLVGNGTNAVSLRAINDMTAKSYIAYDNKPITGNTLAYWNGAYASSNASNLTYCAKGAFGDAAIKAVATSATSGNTALITSGGVYDGLTGKIGCTYGSNTNGNYYKFSDGTLICTKQISMTPAISSAWGSLYENGTKVSLGNWAYTFKATPHISATPTGQYGSMIEHIMSTSTTACGEIRFVRATASTTATIKVDIIGIGRWQ